MDLKVSKARMELAIKILERRAAKSEVAPTFRGITITTEHFDAEHLVMLCRVFADEWGKAKGLSDSLLESQFVGEINRAYLEHKLLRKFVGEAGPSPIEHKKPQPIWRRIWNRIKSWA